MPNWLTKHRDEVVRYGLYLEKDKLLKLSVVNQKVVEIVAIFIRHQPSLSRC